MSAPYRIEKRKTVTQPVRKGATLEEADQPPPPPPPGQDFKDYLGRLLKMIPGEIVGLYMIGNGFIPTDKPLYQGIWAGVCLILLIILRVWGTSDPAAKKPSQPIPVAIAAVAFVIWVYSLGGFFGDYYISWLSSILVLLWSFIVPMIYKGE